MKFWSLMVILNILALLLFFAAIVLADSNTGAFLDSGDSVTFEYVCDDTHSFGVWVKSFNIGGGDASTMSMSVRMTEEEYTLWCLELR